MIEYRLIGETLAQYQLGNQDAAEIALQTLVQDHADDWAYNIAYVQAGIDRPDEAFAWLQRAAANQDSGLVEIPMQPLFAPLYDDPRWLPFLRSIGKAPEQLAAIEFSVSLPN